MLDIGGWEFIALIVLAVVILGPERLPEYAAKLARLVRQARAMAEGAKGQLREQMGPEFDNIDWRQYDPRQYDPRRIVREALLDPTPDQADDASSYSTGTRGYDAAKPTPYDEDAT
jgi:sec-independent protein translocase protein TatB